MSNKICLCFVLVFGIALFRFSPTFRRARRTWLYVILECETAPPTKLKQQAKHNDKMYKIIFNPKMKNKQKKNRPAETLHRRCQRARHRWLREQQNARFRRAIGCSTGKCRITISIAADELFRRANANKGPKRVFAFQGKGYAPQ